MALLKTGSTGPEVSKLQSFLGIPADGQFGPGTEAKVKEWQTAHGLTPDGIVGDATLAKMYGTSTPAAPQTQVTIPASNFKLEKLKGHIPDAVLAQIPDTAAKFELNTPLRLAHFLAQCGHESGGFKVVNENLNYGAKGLLGIFKKYFPTEEKAKLYESLQVITTESDIDASKLKSYVTKGDFTSFKKAMPSTMRELDARRLMNEMRQVNGLELLKEEVKFTVDALREKYFKGEIYHVGDIVESNGQQYEIMDRGSNYLVVVNNTGDLSRKWVKDVKLVESKKLDKACWKGYKAIGLKKKNGKTVPNCVPEQVQEQHTKIDHNSDHKAISHGPHFSFKIHTDHHDKIKNLGHNEQYTFKCMEGTEYGARKVGDKLHFQQHPGDSGIHGNLSVHIPHADFMGDDEKQVSYKGYTTSNFHHAPELAKAFKLVAVDAKDPVAMLNAVKTTDAYLDIHNLTGDNPTIDQVKNWKHAHIKAKEALQKIGVFDKNQLQYEEAGFKINTLAEALDIGKYSTQNVAQSARSYQAVMKWARAALAQSVDNKEIKQIIDPNVSQQIDDLEPQWPRHPHTKVGHTLAVRDHHRRQKVSYVSEEVDEKDTITFDIPLLIRVLEMTREDVKTDAQLHKVVEKLINIRDKGVLTMDDYKFVSQLKEQYVTELASETDGEVEGQKVTKIKPLPPELSPTTDEPGKVKGKGNSAFFEKKAKTENLDYLDLDSWLRQQSPKAKG